MKYLIKTSVVLVLLSPFLALAATIPAPDSGHIDSWINSLIGWVSDIWIILIGVGVIVFFWGIISYVLAGADEEKRKTGRNLMVYGVIGLFVMVAIWGLVYFIGSVLGITIGGSVDMPVLPTPSASDEGD